MAESDSNLVTKIAVKKNSGATEQHSIGVSFDKVVDMRKDKIHYSLGQFFDNYMNFMKSKDTGFIYRGTTQPQTDKACIWLDTTAS